MICAQVHCALSAQNNPNLTLIAYSRAKRAVHSRAVVPKHLFTPSNIEERKPLAPTARRAEWIGCNMLIGRVPDAGKSFIVRDGKPVGKHEVIEAWRKTLFLLAEIPETRGWLIETLNCVESTGRDDFSLAAVYA